MPTRGLKSRVALLSRKVDFPIWVVLVTGSLARTPLGSGTYWEALPYFSFQPFVNSSRRPARGGRLGRNCIMSRTYQAPSIYLQDMKGRLGGPTQVAVITCQ